MNSRTIVTHRFLRWACLIILALGSPVSILAQVSTATVAGLVEDSSKASIPEASVKLINTETGTENSSTTNGQGSFLLPGIIPGAYTLQIERKGFATTQVTGILLNVGDTKNLLIRMKVGAVTETVTVDASGLTLNTTDASVSTVVDRKFVSTIPLNGRSFQDLISMTPGIVTQSPQAATQNGSGTQGDFSVNGQRTESNSFFVDGVSANINSGLESGQSRLASTGSIAGSTALGTTQSLVSVDALQEFRVLTSTYSAEYGRTPGGQFTFLTRSGTNTVHGSFFDYFRYFTLDGADWFANSLGPFHPAPYNQADFGGTLGAPVILPHAYNGRDKTFVFVSYEGMRLRQPTPQTYLYTPAVCGMGTYFVSCNDDTNNVPLAMQLVLGNFPYPLIGTGTTTDPEIIDAAGKRTGLAHYVLPPYSLPAHVNSTSIRLDHAFSSKLSMFLRYGGTPSYGQTGQLESVTQSHVNSQTLTLGVTSQSSATTSNEFRVGYAENQSRVDTAFQSLPDYAYGYSSLLSYALGIPSSYASASAEAYIHIVGVGDTESNINQATGSLHQWNIRDTFSLQARNHLFKFGIDQRRIASTVNPPAISVQADFFDRNSMATNSASDIVITKSSPASPILNEFSAFVEDEWKVRNALTLSLGFRWDVNPAPTGQHGQDAYTVLGDVDDPATLRLAPRGTPLWHTSWYNLAPRLGAAWVADDEPGKELIIRAGGGIFFDTGTQPALRAFNGIGFATSAHYANVPVPVTPAQLTFSTAVAPPYTNTSAFGFPAHLQLPYSLQWNVSVEKALDKNQSITVSYVGASGHRLLQEQRRNVNQFNPDFGDVSYFPSGVTSSYQAMQAKFQRVLSHGVEALASYTWAHSLDYGSTEPAFPLVRGNADLDVRHNLEGAVSWDLPKPPGNRFVKKLVGSWGADGRLMARTGFPVNLAGNFFLDPVTGSTYSSGVNLISNRPLYLHGPNYPGHRIFNGGRTQSILPSACLQAWPREMPRGIFFAVSARCR